MNEQIEELAKRTWAASTKSGGQFMTWFNHYVGPHLNIARSLIDDPPEAGKPFIAYRTGGPAGQYSGGERESAKIALAFERTHWTYPATIPVKSKRQEWEEKKDKWIEDHWRSGAPYEAFAEICPPPKETE